MNEARVSYPEDVDPILEGSEFVKILFHTDKIVFSIASLLPGQEGALDPGHNDAHEIGYVIQGKIAVTLDEETKEVKEGGAILISEGVPHKVINVSNEIAIMAWSTAPSLGRDPIHE